MLTQAVQLAPNNMGAHVSGVGDLPFQMTAPTVRSIVCELLPRMLNAIAPQHLTSLSAEHDALNMIPQAVSSSDSFGGTAVHESMWNWLGDLELQGFSAYQADLVACVSSRMGHSEPYFAPTTCSDSGHRGQHSGPNLSATSPDFASGPSANFPVGFLPPPSSTPDTYAIRYNLYYQPYQE